MFGGLVAETGEEGSEEEQWGEESQDKQKGKGQTQGAIVLGRQKGTQGHGGQGWAQLGAQEGGANLEK